VPAPRSDRRVPGQRAGLTLDTILVEARQLARDEGVERLTMRALADRLGVAPNALYSYVADKSALVDELLDAVLGDVATSDLDTMGWRDGLIELMRRSRGLLLSQADLLPRFLSRPARGPNAIRLGEASLALLARAGLDGARAVEALRVLLVYTFGYAAMEAPRRAEPEPDRRRIRSATAFASSPDRPRMASLAEPLSRPATDATFELGLGWVLDGIAALTGQHG
jgi:AcrR family transcriptional regulator